MGCKSPERFEKYKHQKLINELNDFMIRIKVVILSDVKNEDHEKYKKMQENSPAPTIEEIDKIHMKLNEVLFEQTEPLLKY